MKVSLADTALWPEQAVKLASTARTEPALSDADHDQDEELQSTPMHGLDAAKHASVPHSPARQLLRS